MKDVRLPYTVKKRGNLFWQPTPAMKAMGFEPKALGPETAETIAQAHRLYDAWVEVKANQRKVTTYPPGTFGAFWDRFRRTPGWAKKSPRTREDYERAWRHIDRWRPEQDRPTLSRTVVTAITTELCEQFYDHLDETASPSERHRTIKWFKVLLDDMVVRLRLDYASPAANLKNPQPRGRSQIWLAAEVEDLSAVAAIAGFEGMSLAIETAWETMFSPVDVRTLRPRQMKRDAEGWYFHRNRTKTLAEAFGHISDGLAERLLGYIARQNRAEADDTPIFRSREIPAGALGGRPREGRPYATKDRFGGDFRLVREIIFPGDERQLLDIRRSANVEADAAGADKKTMGELLANGLADSRFLDETYTPPTVTKAREVAAQRATGRAKLAGEAARLRTAS
jgi:hypothetical protein